jgi:hypothetical protein
MLCVATGISTDVTTNLEVLDRVFKNELLRHLAL